MAIVGEIITVKFAGQTKMEVNDAEGKRQLKLSFMKTLAEPRKMIISCSNNNEFENIFEAEVVFCYGDRNNEYLQKQ